MPTPTFICWSSDNRECLDARAPSRTSATSETKIIPATASAFIASTLLLSYCCHDPNWGGCARRVEVDDNLVNHTLMKTTQRQGSQDDDVCMGQQRKEVMAVTARVNWVTVSVGAGSQPQHRGMSVAGVPPHLELGMKHSGRGRTCLNRWTGQTRELLL